MEQFIRTTKALSDPRRLRILKVLESGPLCPKEIQVMLGLPLQHVSQIMKILQDAALVKKERRGTWIFYRLSSDGSDSAYTGAMLSVLKDWLNEDEELNRMIAALPEEGHRQVNAVKRSRDGSGENRAKRTS